MSNNYCVVDEETETSHFFENYDGSGGAGEYIKTFGNTPGYGYEEFYIDGSTWKSKGSNYVGNSPKNPPS